MTAAVPVIAVDGPGGAGKGTVCRAVAMKLGWHLLDSGALYRLVALAAADRGIDLADEAAVADVAAGLSVEFGSAGDDERVLLDGVDVTAAIRSEAAGLGASAVARLPAVRRALVGRQRAFRRLPGLVADGRDMGSMIFPDAALKIYLTASVEERARRRHKQLKEKGIDVSLPALTRELVQRDQQDSSRSVAPLKPCQDARVLDTTGMDVDQVVARVLRWVGDSYQDSQGPGGL